MRRQIIVGLLLVGAVAALLYILQSDAAPYYKICNTNQYTGYKECTPHHIPYVVVWCIGEFLNYISPVLTAIATAAIAYFTWTIKAISDEELAHTRPIERAYLSAGGVWERIPTLSATPTGHPFASSTPTENFQLHINNHGTSGRLLEIAVEFCDVSAIPAQPQYSRIDILISLGREPKQAIWRVSHPSAKFVRPVCRWATLVSRHLHRRNSFVWVHPVSGPQSQKHRSNEQPPSD